MDIFINIKDSFFKKTFYNKNKIENTHTIIEIADIQPLDKLENVFIKLLLVGSSGVGKTSILERYTVNNFYQHFITTIGVDYRFKNIMIDNYNVKLQLWDTASQERFRCITRNYYRNSHIIIICYDITDLHSFNDLEYWINDAIKHLSEPVLMAICGTKMDLKTQRVITYTDAKNYADYKNLEYFEISSKNNDGINFMFESLIKTKITELNFIKESKPIPDEEKYEILKINPYDTSYYDYNLNCCWI